MRKVDISKIDHVEEYRRVGGRLVLIRTMTVEEAEALKWARIEKGKRTRERKKSVK